MFIDVKFLNFFNILVYNLYISLNKSKKKNVTILLYFFNKFLIIQFYHNLTNF